MKVFITAQLTPSGINRLKAHMDISFGGWGTTGLKLSPEQLVEQARDCDILIICYEEITEYVLSNLPNLKLICCTRGGVENIQPQVIKNHPEIFICNAPGRNANAVADLTMALLLCAARFIPQTHHFIMSKRWDRVPWDIAGNTPRKTFAGYELEYKKLGLIGYGAIAKKVKRRAQGFDMNVIAYDPFLKQEDVDIPLVSLEALLCQSDFVSLHCKLTQNTKNIIDKNKLALMKPSACLINTARGELVDEAALFEALDNKRIMAAALDTQKQEPMSFDNPFLLLDNIILTPHIGGASHDIPAQQTKLVLEDIFAYLETGRPVHVLS